jgi:MoaA/NifB/PqqE/SkfB family radical SAM enzyme
MADSNGRRTTPERLAIPALVHATSTLARVSPVRRTVVGLIEGWMRRDSARSRANSGLPLGVCDDRAVMRLALLRTIERVLSESNLAPAVLRNAGQAVLRATMQRGNQRTSRGFRARHGKYPPGFLTISPGKACNLRCTGCYADSGQAAEKLDWSTFDRIITETKTLWGKNFFVLSGGEPFAYRSEGKGILEAAGKHDDCLFMAYTNGTLIDGHVAQRLAQVGNLSPAISLEGWREHTDARRGEGVFAQAMAAMAQLRKAGVPFGVSLTATRHNADEIMSEEFIDFLFSAQGALYGWIFHYMPIGRAHTLDLMPTPQQRLELWRRSWEIIREKRIFLADFWNHGTAVDGCLSAGGIDGGGYMYIDWNGSVTPCVFVPYSPVSIEEVYARGGTLTDAWTDPFFAGIRDWQAGYKKGNGKHGNWLAPCIIRDHHDEFRRLLREHEPDPSDSSAEEALMDPEYEQGMVAYGAAYQELSGEVWRKQYLRAEEAGRSESDASIRRKG